MTPFPRAELIDSSPLLDNPSELRARAQEAGYLLLRGLLPKEPLLALRREMLLILQRRGWLEEKAPLMEAVGNLDAIARSDAEDPIWKYIGVGGSAYREVQHLESFHALAHHPRLIRLYETLFGEAVLPHPRNIARILMPAPSLSPTPPHQDYVHIQGSHDFWTCWFPLGDCPRSLGGLSVLRHSHREGVLPVAAAAGAGNLETILCDHPELIWLETDYACGDIITFGSHTVHKGLPNQQPGRIRLSCDFRYQPAGAEIEERSLLPHANVATWEEIYAGWNSTRFQYYWKSKTLRFSGWDESLRAEQEKIC